jgi:hypothetical protein
VIKQKGSKKEWDKSVAGDAHLSPDNAAQVDTVNHMPKPEPNMCKINTFISTSFLDK